MFLLHGIYVYRCLYVCTYVNWGLMWMPINLSHASTSVGCGLLHTVANLCPRLTVTVTILSFLLSLVLTMSLSTCTGSAVVHAVMYKRLQRCRADLRGGELCSTPQLSQSLLWSRAAASLHTGGGDSVKAGPEGEGPLPREKEEEKGEKMQANLAYLPIEMSYKSQESKYINVSSWSDWRRVCIDIERLFTFVCRLPLKCPI